MLERPRIIVFHCHCNYCGDQTTSHSLFDGVLCVMSSQNKSIVKNWSLVSGNSCSVTCVCNCLLDTSSVLVCAFIVLCILAQRKIFISLDVGTAIIHADVM